MKALLIALAAALPLSGLAQTATPPAPATPPPPPARGPALDAALLAAQTAVQACIAIDQKVSVSVVDSAGVLKTLLAADGASARGVQSSTNKAITALTFKAPTSELGERIKTDTALADQINANSNYNVRAGGILVKVGNEVIGAIGVGGARGSEKDEQCALAGLAKVQAQLK